ncbi:hypothetical protein SLA2020_395400 [Shorea laevis]
MSLSLLVQVNTVKERTSISIFCTRPDGENQGQTISILWEKSETWRWIVRKTRDSNPFFLSFDTLCGFVPGVVGYGVVQLTNSLNEQLEAQLRQNARPDSLLI